MRFFRFQILKQSKTQPTKKNTFLIKVNENGKAKWDDMLICTRYLQ